MGNILHLLKHNLLYFHDELQYIENKERHSQATCLLCNPTVFGMTFEDALVWLTRRLLVLDIGDRKEMAGHILEMQGMAGEYESKEIEEYVTTVNQDQFLLDWSKGPRTLASRLVAEQAMSSVDQIWDSVLYHDGRGYLCDQFGHMLANSNRTPALKKMLFKEAYSISSDPLLEVDRILFEMDRIFDATSFYPLSPFDTLAIRFVIPGLRGLDRETLLNLEAFVAKTEVGYFENAVPVIQSNLIRMNPNYTRYLQNELFPYIQAHYPKIYDKLNNTEMNFLSQLPSVLKGDIITAADLPDKTLSKEDYLYLVEKSPIDSFETANEDADELRSDFEDGHQHEIVRALRKEGITVKVDKKRIGDDDYEDEFDGLIAIARVNYINSKIKPMAFRDGKLRADKYPDDEIFRETIKLELLPQIPKVLRPYVYRALWGEYFETILGYHETEIELVR